MITTREAPVPCWYLSQVGAMGGRLPLASAFQPILAAMGRKYPYWLVAAATGDIVRTIGGYSLAAELVSKEVLEGAANVFGLTSELQLLSNESAVEAMKEQLARSIADARPALVWCQNGNDDWWYPLIGHDEGCRHLLWRSWGQTSHDYHGLNSERPDLIGNSAVCLFEPISEAPTQPELAKRALHHAPRVFGQQAGYEDQAQMLDGMEEAENVNLQTIFSVARGFECILNSKRAAVEYCERSIRLLPVQAEFLERAGFHFARLVSLLAPAAADFGSIQSVPKMINREEKRKALANTYRVAARFEERAVKELEAVVAGPPALVAERVRET